MQSTDWKSWCRLCGKKNGSKIDVNETLAIAISKYFRIVISEENNACTKICIICHDTINSILKYNIHITKVNEMFLELETNHLNKNLSIESLRDKYKLISEMNGLYGNEMRIPDVNSVQVKLDSMVKPENQSTCFLETEIIDFDEIIYLEDGTFDEEANEVLLNDCNEINKKIEDSFENVNAKPENQNQFSKCFLQTTITDVDEVDYLEDNPFDVEPDNELSNESNEINNIKEKSFYNKNVAKHDKKNSVTDLKNKQKKYLACNICEKKFATTKGRTMHRNKKHPVEIGSPPYKCNVCDESFSTIRILDEHARSHLTENDRIFFDCPQCTRKFTKEFYVQHHIRIVHNKERPFVCEQCGAAFGIKKNMVDHYATHTEEKKFKCPKCEKTFKSTRRLKIHLNIHNNIQYVCQICGRKLNTKNTLYSHMITHSDENKYKCNFCSKQFKRVEAFKNHLMSHIGLKPYHCPFCKKTFGSGSTIRTHQKTVHPVELAASESKNKPKFSINVPSIKQLTALNEKMLAANKISKRKVL